MLLTYKDVLSNKSKFLRRYIENLTKPKVTGESEREVLPTKHGGCRFKGQGVGFCQVPSSQSWSQAIEDACVNSQYTFNPAPSGLNRVQFFRFQGGFWGFGSKILVKR